MNPDTTSDIPEEHQIQAGKQNPVSQKMGFLENQKLLPDHKVGEKIQMYAQLHQDNHFEIANHMNPPHVSIGMGINMEFIEHSIFQEEKRSMDQKKKDYQDLMNMKLKIQHEQQKIDLEQEKNALLREVLANKLQLILNPQDEVLKGCIDLRQERISVIEKEISALENKMKNQQSKNANVRQNKTFVAKISVYFSF